MEPPDALDERARRIVQEAIDLAERDGYAAVRLRDVAGRARVALGTVYRRFRSKEDILVAALEQEAERLEGDLFRSPAAGADAHGRTASLFGTLTRSLCRRPNLTKATLRAVASGDADLARKVARFHSVITRQVVAALAGPGAPGDGSPATGSVAARAEEVAALLQGVWFASLVGWAGGLHDEETIHARMEQAIGWILAGAATAPADAAARGGRA